MVLAERWLNNIDKMTFQQFDRERQNAMYRSVRRIEQSLPDPYRGASKVKYLTGTQVIQELILATKQCLSAFMRHDIGKMRQSMPTIRKSVKLLRFNCPQIRLPDAVETVLKYARRNNL